MRAFHQAATDNNVIELRNLIAAGVNKNCVDGSVSLDLVVQFHKQ
jgi:hypothetical protein